MEETFVYPDLDSNPAYQLWLVSNAWQRLVRKALDPFGLTHVQFVILAAIARLSTSEETVTQAQVARFGALDENMTSQVIRAMEKKGLVDRCSHPSDARAHCLSLTAAGTQLWSQARVVVKPVTHEFFSKLGGREPELVEMLKLLAESPLAES